jgi:hypothetical protein
VYADAERGLYSRVRELLKSPYDHLILRAWSDCEKRLEAECEGKGCPASLSERPEAGTGPGPDASSLPGGGVDPKPASMEHSMALIADKESFERSRAEARQAVVMPILKVKRWTRGKWATKAAVGKNSVYGYLDGNRTLSDENRQAMGDALGLKTLPE